MRGNSRGPFYEMAEGFKIEITHNVESVIRNLGEVRDKDVIFVTAYALTKTAQDVKAEEVRVMGSVFDRPTKFTLNALYVRPATKADLSAVVEFKPGFNSVPAWRYLGPQVTGGGRRHKSFERRLIEAGLMKSSEFAVPASGAPLDSYGNVSGSYITRMLSMLGAQADSQQNTTVASRGRAKSKARGQFLVLREGHGAHPGIYKREGAREIKPIFLFDRAPSYKQRFPFYETGLASVQRTMAMHFTEGWQKFVVNAPQRKTT